jgi:hypothetical protein
MASVKKGSRETVLEAGDSVPPMKTMLASQQPFG